MIKEIVCAVVVVATTGIVIWQELRKRQREKERRQYYHDGNQYPRTSPNCPPECGICGETTNYLDRSSPHCGHVLHRSCILKKMVEKCPTCNKPIL